MGLWQSVSYMRPISDGSPSGVPSLVRSIGVLKALADPCRQGATARELQKRCGIPKASLYRLLQTLTEAGLLAQNAASGHFHLGPELLRLGFVARATSPLVAAAKPLLRAITHATHEMSELAIPVGRWDLMMLETWQAEGTPVQVVSRPGHFFKMNHLNAHGLCFLCFDSERRLNEYVRGTRAPDMRQRFGLDQKLPDGLPEECERWRRLGYVWKSQAQVNARARVAVPVFDPHATGKRMIGTLGVVCDSRRLSAPRAAQWAITLQQQARQLEMAMT